MSESAGGGAVSRPTAQELVDSLTQIEETMTRKNFPFELSSIFATMNDARMKGCTMADMAGPSGAAPINVKPPAAPEGGPSYGPYGMAM